MLALSVALPVASSAEWKDEALATRFGFICFPVEIAAQWLTGL